MKDLLLKNWDITRILRMLIGVGIGGYSLWSGDYFLLVLSGLFIVQALFNLSCCGTAGCSTTAQSKALYKDVIKPYEPTDSKNK